MDLEIVPAEILSTGGCPQTVEKYYLREEMKRKFFV